MIRSFPEGARARLLPEGARARLLPEGARARLLPEGARARLLFCRSCWLFEFYRGFISYGEVYGVCYEAFFAGTDVEAFCEEDFSR